MQGALLYAICLHLLIANGPRVQDKYKAGRKSALPLCECSTLAKPLMVLAGSRLLLTVFSCALLPCHSPEVLLPSSSEWQKVTEYDIQILYITLGPKQPRRDW